MMGTTFSVWKRYYKSNFELVDGKNAAYIGSIAYVVQEYLYTDKASFVHFDCNMSNRIMLYDFMSVESHFLNSLDSDLYEATLKGYIKILRQRRYERQKHDDIQYVNDGNSLVIFNASSELIVSLLWTTFIYCYSRYEIEDAKAWLDKSNKLYKLMLDNYPYTKDIFKDMSPFKHMDEAAKLLKERIKKKRDCKEQTAIKADGTENLEARIAELEEKCKQQEEKIKEYEEAAESIDLHDKIRLDLLLRLLKNDGANLDKHGNKTKAAQIMQSITGLPLQTCKNFCSEPNANTKLHGEEVLKINALLQALDMEIRL